MESEECEIGGMSKEWCAHCRKDPSPELDYATVEFETTAKYSGNGCVSDGRHAIRSGERIGRVPDSDGGGWLCQRCLERMES